MQHHVFATPLGPIALVWNPEGLRAISWGEGGVKDWARTVAARHRSQESPLPPALHGWKENLLGYASRGHARFPSLSFRGLPPFHARVYQELRRTRPGETISYGELARRAGSPRAARAVGDAMRRNPFVIAVPCHRVVRTGRDLGSYSGPGGEEGKLRLLRLEGAKNLP